MILKQKNKMSQIKEKKIKLKKNNSKLETCLQTHTKSIIIIIILKFN